MAFVHPFEQSLALMAASSRLVTKSRSHSGSVTRHVVMRSSTGPSCCADSSSSASSTMTSRGASAGRGGNAPPADWIKTTHVGSLPRERGATLSADTIIANQKMKAECWDIGNAYLNANWTERKLYVCLDSDLVTIMKEKFPDVIIHQDNLGRSYFQVQRAVYGSLQAAALWYKEVSETLNNAGYKQNSYEKCLWQKKVGNEIIIFS